MWRLLARLARLRARAWGATMTEPRGVRNNNPFNLIRTNPRAGWEGAVSDSDLTDPRFEQFVSPVWGLRAGAETLLNYQVRDGCQTIAGIIHRYAPPVENDTGAYVADVAARMGYAPDAVVSLRNVPPLVALSRAIIEHENGECPYDDDLIAVAAIDAIYDVLGEVEREPARDARGVGAPQEST